MEAMKQRKNEDAGMVKSKGGPRNRTFYPDKNGGTESLNVVSDFSGENGDSKENHRDERMDDVKVETPNLQKNDAHSIESVERNGHDASIINNGKIEDGKVKPRETSEHIVFLEGLYDKPASCEFYCPKCNFCVTKVIIRGREAKISTPYVPPPPAKNTAPVSPLPVENTSPLRQFPIDNSGSISPPLVENTAHVSPPSAVNTTHVLPPPTENTAHVTPPSAENTTSVPSPPPENTTHVSLPAPFEPYICDLCLGFLIPAGKWIYHKFVPENQGSIAPVHTGHTTVPIIEPKPEPEPRPGPIPAPGDTKTFEIMKSIVYGGLAEAMTSLGIVTSAASADTATLNILALAIANLVGGLFIIGHNLWKLKDEQLETYKKTLGEEENFILHAPVAILSFVVFGLVPPLVYGFSFPQSNNSDLKIAAVAAASLLCIIVLAVGEAYIQRQQKYIKTILYYVIMVIVVGVVSYLAGDLIDKLIEKLGWFSSEVSGSLPQMGIVNPALASY